MHSSADVCMCIRRPCKRIVLFVFVAAFVMGPLAAPPRPRERATYTTLLSSMEVQEQ